MAQNIIILLTEGDHDAAFLYRILKANGFPKFSNVIKNFPPPLNELLAADILNVSIPEVNIQSARTRFLPSNVVTEGDNIILIYALQGDSRSENRIKLIDAFNSFNTRNPKQIQVIDNISFSVLYFLDADDKGIDIRLDEINKELKSVFASNFDKFSENASLKKIDDVLVGAYIFVEAGKQTGKLEDILIPMMSAGNEDIFKLANDFLSIHENTNLFRGNVKYNEDKSIKKIFEDKYYPKKSLIGAVGQLQKSGKSNTVCISDANYLNDDKLKACNVCNEILSFVKKAMK